MTTKAVFFDVDFTLIYPGPTFRGEGYRAFCARYGMDVDAGRFADAVASASPLLDGPDALLIDPFCGNRFEFSAEMTFEVEVGKDQTLGFVTDRQRNVC